CARRERVKAGACGLIDQVCPIRLCESARASSGKWSSGMRRRIVLVVGLVLGSLILAGCDNCGGWQKFNTPSLTPSPTPGQPKSCHAEPPPG
ncbi:MAG: hypothetical protein ACLPID_07510, partial [Beijerinckiaceae bacterium]